MKTTQNSKTASLVRAFINALLKVENPHFRNILVKLKLLKGLGVPNTTLIAKLEAILQEFFASQETSEQKKEEKEDE